MIEIVLIAAVAENGVIGSGGTMPWRLKSDMAHFRALTIGKPVVMGRKTYLSTSIRPLPRRTNIVITRDKDYAAPGIVAVTSLEAALQVARADALRRGTNAIMVIGGADVYAQAMGRADRLEITQIHARPAGDTRFPEIDPGVWHEIARQPHPPGEGDDAAYDLVTYRRQSTGKTPG